jgi:small basic protein
MGNMGHDADQASAGGRAAWLAKLLVPVLMAGHVLFYDVLPALLAWVVGAAEALDLFAGFDAPSVHRLAGLGMFLSAVAAIITTESVTWMGRPFRVAHYLATVVVIGAALFPSLADWHRLRTGLTPDQFAVVQAYCYLALKVAVGILVGATVSWILLTRQQPLASVPKPQYSRK